MILQQSNWRVRAACRDVDPDQLFVQGADQRRAKVVCLACPVRTECLAEALDRRVEFGVWGGMTERERRALLRRRPEVPSWWELLDAARRQHQALDHDDELGPCGLVGAADDVDGGVDGAVVGRLDRAAGVGAVTGAVTGAGRAGAVAGHAGDGITAALRAR